MRDLGKHPIRSLKSFGVAGLLGEKASVFYDSLFSPTHLGRVSDLLCARLRKAGADEARFRILLMLGVFQSYRAQKAVEKWNLLEATDLEAPIVLECGIDDEKIAFAVSCTLPEGYDFQHEGLVEKVKAEPDAESFEYLIFQLNKFADRLVIKFQPAERRVEVGVMLGLLGKIEDTQASHEEGLEVVVIEQLEETPEVGEYTQMGDTNYKTLLQDNSPSKKYAEKGLANMLVSSAAGELDNALQDALLARGRKVNEVDDVNRTVPGQVLASDSEQAQKVLGGSEVVSTEKVTLPDGTEVQIEKRKLADGTIVEVQRKVLEGGELGEPEEVIVIKPSGSGKDATKKVGGSDGADINEDVIVVKSSESEDLGEDGEVMVVKAEDIDENTTEDDVLKKIEEAAESAPADEKAEAKARLYRSQISQLFTRIKKLEAELSGSGYGGKKNDFGPDNSIMKVKSLKKEDEVEDDEDGEEEEGEEGSKKKKKGPDLKKAISGLFGKLKKKKGEDEDEEEEEEYEEGEEGEEAQYDEYEEGEEEEEEEEDKKEEKEDEDERVDTKEVAKNVLLSIEAGSFERATAKVEENARRLKGILKSEKAKALVKELNSTLLKEKKNHKKAVKRLCRGVRQRELEFHNKERFHSEQMRKKDETIRQKEKAIIRGKDQLSQINMQMERFKKAAGNANKSVQLEKKLMMAQTEKAKMTMELEDLKRKLEESRKKVSTMSEGAAASQDVSIEKEKNSKLKKDLDTLRKETIRITQKQVKDSELLKQQLAASEKDRAKLANMIKAMSKKNEGGGSDSSGGSNAA